MDHCPLCESDQIDLLYPSNFPATGSRGGIYNCTSVALGVHPDIFRCRSCTFVFNEPARGLVNHLDEYGRVEDPEYLEQRESRRITYARELDRIEKVCRGRDLLDVGCYTGFFLDDARRRLRYRGRERENDDEPDRVRNPELLEAERPEHQQVEHEHRAPQDTREKRRARERAP